MYTFENERYVTRGVNAEIPLGVQVALWNAIDELRNTEKVLDYFKVLSSIENWMNDLEHQIAKWSS